jgi:hypothetical protein
VVVGQLPVGYAFLLKLLDGDGLLLGVLVYSVLPTTVRADGVTIVAKLEVAASQPYRNPQHPCNKICRKTIGGMNGLPVRLTECALYDSPRPPDGTDDPIATTDGCQAFFVFVPPEGFS